MAREAMSRPVRLAVEHGVIRKGRGVLDFGCGRGADVDALKAVGISATGWDPMHRPDGRRRKTSVVYFGYVVNVIEDPIERAATLESAWSYAAGVLIVAARLEHERDEAHSRPYADGWLTAHRTFQKFFDQLELGNWIQRVLGVRPVAAGPGIYYVFRSSSDREQFVAQSFRLRMPTIQTRKSDRLFLEHKTLLRPLMDFVAERGRLPRSEEVRNEADLVSTFGSTKKAFRIVVTVTDEDAWKRVSAQRAVDLLVYLALSRFEGDLKFSEFPPSIQHDIRAFEGSHKQAMAKADRLLFAVGNPDALLIGMRSALVGKNMPTAFYVHRDALGEVPAVLRVYEGCARQLVGDVEGGNIIKLARVGNQVSYLAYPDFDTDAHPALVESFTVDVRALSVKRRRYSEMNPPILHRKELFVSTSDPRRETFALLTAAEERAGLYSEPASIGTRSGWAEALARASLEVDGHRLRPAPRRG
jgi:DNA phosphorothioation-associated putative methyltransferase